MNLGQLSLFFPERRDFFLDDSDLYDFGINRDPCSFTAGGLDWMPVAIVRMWTSASKPPADLVNTVWGFLNTKMNGSGEIDGENLGVLRLRTDVLRESTAGSS